MPKYLVLPKIGMNMEEGVISEWLVKPGDRVEKEQMVVRAETDKAIQDMFATESGIVYKLLVQPGDVVPCQEKIAILLDEGEEYVDDEAEEKKEEPQNTTSLEPAVGQRVESVLKAEKPENRIRISPLARKLARDLGITEDELRPAHEGKRIVKADVLRCREELAAKEKQTEEEGDVFVPFSRKRQVIARRMTESFNQKPRVTMVTTVDCEQLMAFREHLKVRSKVGYNEIIAKVCAVALKKYSELNCIRKEEGICIKKAVNIGIAVDTEAGLLVPVLKDVQKKGILELAEEFQKLVEKARNGRLSAEEMSGGTFSVSNVGMYGIESFNPIVNPPECFILGVGCMKECPVVINHEVCIRTCMELSLSFDHAVFDGATAAKLLKEIKELLEEPLMLLA